MCYRVNTFSSFIARDRREKTTRPNEENTASFSLPEPFFVKSVLTLPCSTTEACFVVLATLTAIFREYTRSSVGTNSTYERTTHVGLLVFTDVF